MDKAQKKKTLTVCYTASSKPYGVESELDIIISN